MLFLLILAATFATFFIASVIETKARAEERDL